MVELTREHMRIVRKVRWHCFRSLPHRHSDELMGAGMVGLVKAARRYDDSRGMSFENYAWRRVHGAMQDHLRSIGFRTSAGTPVEGSRKPTLVLTKPTSRVFHSLVDPVGDWERDEDLNDAINALPASQQYAVRMVCLHGYSQTEVGRTLGVSGSRVCQIVRSARESMALTLAA